jgi:DNA-binding CsgD family transcriptional regulator
MGDVAPQVSRVAKTGTLSPTEIRVLEGLRDGMTNREIAAHLERSPSTIRTHLHNIYGKLNVGDRAQAVLVAIRTGLIEPPQGLDGVVLPPGVYVFRTGHQPVRLDTSRVEISERADDGHPAAVTRRPLTPSRSREPPRKGPSLRVAPFQEWLENVLVAEGRKRGSNNERAANTIARRLGVGSDIVNRWRDMAGSASLPLDAVKNAVDRFGVGLSDVYPDMEDTPDVCFYVEDKPGLAGVTSDDDWASTIETEPDLEGDLLERYCGYVGLARWVEKNGVLA